jgi:hypothetical protein
VFIVLAMAAMLVAPATSAFATSVQAGPNPVAPGTTQDKPTVKVVVIGDTITSGE